jgi:heptosyltransferase-2
MKILVRAPNWIGDSVLALPAIECLSKNFPQAEIWVAAKEWVKDIFYAHDFIKEVLLLPESDDIKGLRNLAQKIKELEFEIGILFTNSFFSALIFYLAKIPQRWGYSRDGRGILLTKGVAVKEQEANLHQLIYYLNLISELGLKTYPPKLSLVLTPEEKRQAKELLLSFNIDLKRPLAILSPGASYGPAKRWPASKFAELANLLSERKKVRTLVIGSSNEIELAEAIASSMKEEPINLSGKTSLRLLASLIIHADLFITNDSGPMHLANALNVPVVAIFGPTDPAITGPFQEPAAVIKKDVPCWPCSYRECPFDHRCMMNIDVEEVYQACQKFLE